MRALPRKTALRVLLTGIFIATVGDALASIAFTLQAAISDRPELLAMVLLADLIPGIIFGLVGGFLADKQLRWWWWPCVLILQASIYVFMSLSMQWSVIIGGIAVVSAISALIGPVSKKLVAYYSDDDTKVGGRLALISGLAQALGLIVGGASIGAGAIQLMVLGCALTLTVLFIVSLFVAVPQAIHLDSGKRRGLWDGFSMLVSPRLFGITGVALMVGVVMSTSFEGVVNVFVLTRIAGFTPFEFSVACAVWAMAIIVGSLTAPKIKISGFWGLAVSGVGIGLPIAATGLFLPPLILIIPLYFLGGYSNGFFNSLINRIILGVADEQQGRAWAAFHWIVNVCLLVGYTVGGAWGSQFAQELMILAGGGVVVLVGVCTSCKILTRKKAEISHNG
ncbi:hypothetical protein [uncultured Rothia sp.]|uniref:hypothetical protein n=1 Tax=uncultured Rothia sp. TaxID=316088 RepID=UPI00321660A3